MSARSHYAKEDLLACARGELFGIGNPQLPAPPMLMFDRITQISETIGGNGRGEVRAELDLDPALWFFGCHFPGDPVMPGCLGLDAMWQIVGFYLGWLGGEGHGRALGVGQVKFTGQVLPSNRLVSYHVQIKRVVRRKLYMGVADGAVTVDGQLIYQASDLRVGLFRDVPGAPVGMGV